MFTNNIETIRNEIDKLYDLLEAYKPSHPDMNNLLLFQDTCQKNWKYIQIYDGYLSDVYQSKLDEIKKFL